jgi:hypothetical protein
MVRKLTFQARASDSPNHRKLESYRSGVQPQPDTTKMPKIILKTAPYAKNTRFSPCVWSAVLKVQKLAKSYTENIVGLPVCAKTKMENVFRIVCGSARCGHILCISTLAYIYGRKCSVPKTSPFLDSLFSPFSQPAEAILCWPLAPLVTSPLKASKNPSAVSW